MSPNATLHVEAPENTKSHSTFTAPPKRPALVEPSNATPENSPPAHSEPMLPTSAILDARDYAPDTREELIPLKAAHDYLRYEKCVDNTVRGLTRACKLGFGPQHWAGRNNRLLTTYEALERWIALPRFQQIYKSKLIVGPLPPRDPERDYITLANIFPGWKRNV